MTDTPLLDSINGLCQLWQVEANTLRDKILHHLQQGARLRVLIEVMSQSTDMEASVASAREGFAVTMRETMQECEIASDVVMASSIRMFVGTITEKLCERGQFGYEPHRIEGWRTLRGTLNQLLALHDDRQLEAHDDQ